MIPLAPKTSKRHRADFQPYHPQRHPPTRARYRLCPSLRAHPFKPRHVLPAPPRPKDTQGAQAPSGGSWCRGRQKTAKARQGRQPHPVFSDRPRISVCICSLSQASHAAFRLSLGRIQDQSQRSIGNIAVLRKLIAQPPFFIEKTSARQ